MNLHAVRTRSLSFLIIISLTYNISFSQTGFVFGDHGTLLKTTNGGANWIQKPSGTSLGLWNSCFINENTGWVAGGTEGGGAGVLLKTTNTGETWIEQSTGITNMWYTGVSFLNSLTGFLIGDHGTILKTTNAGANWRSIDSGLTSITLETIVFSDSLNGWITGWSGMLLKTTDGGNTWSVINSGTTSNLFTAYFLSQQTGYIAGSAGAIQKTTNQGANWVGVTSGTTQHIFSIFFIGVYGWIAADLGTLRLTTDAGNTWSAGTIGTSTRLETVDFIDLHTGWVVGGYNGSVLYKSTDGGQNWFAQISNTVERLWSVYFYVPLVGIEPISNTMPTDYSLHQNYPNPFNPVTKIRFDLRSASSANQNVVLKIYNELGEETATLVNQDLRAGTYEINWDASGFSSGTYFCRLLVSGSKQSGSSVFSKTMKMTLSK